MRHGYRGVDPLVAMTALMLGARHQRRTEGRRPAPPPTPEQLARRERNEWNAEVERKKAERQERRLEARWGANRESQS